MDGRPYTIPGINPKIPQNVSGGFKKGPRRNACTGHKRRAAVGNSLPAQQKTDAAAETYNPR
jgi:hypothetical protein